MSTLSVVLSFTWILASTGLQNCFALAREQMTKGVKAMKRTLPFLVASALYCWLSDRTSKNRFRTGR